MGRCFAPRARRIALIKKAAERSRRVGNSKRKSCAPRLIRHAELGPRHRHRARQQYQMDDRDRRKKLKRRTIRHSTVRAGTVAIENHRAGRSEPSPQRSARPIAEPHAAIPAPQYRSNCQRIIGRSFVMPWDISHAHVIGSAGEAVAAYEAALYFPGARTRSFAAYCLLPSAHCPPSTALRRWRIISH